MFDFISRRKYFFTLSAAIILCGILFFAISGIPWGIDFTGGTMMTLAFDSPVEQSAIEKVFSESGHSEAEIQGTEGNSYFVRTKELEQAERDQIIAALTGLGMTEKPSFDSVSNPVAKEKAEGATWAVIVAAIAILVYISWAFRKLPNPFRYGTCAIIALVHDILIALSVFAILGSTLNLEINLMFITGLLTVIGYSVNDTIVVFDRIRENLGKSYRQSFRSVVNNSLMETLSRSLNTSFTTLIVLVAVYLFVGEAIESFMLVLIAGVISGTYSSIFIASQFLVIWESGSFKRLFTRA